ncbi:MAG: DUF2442 domain-containing protein [Chitinophagaceae bacterium]|nr:DUF2442 domain-containing protein [Anaerolineae bacterium]
MSIQKTSERIEPYSGLHTDRNDAVAVELNEKYLIITTRDERIIYVPLAWFPWLINATTEQRADYENNQASIYWPQLDDGVSMQVILLGRYGK